MHWTVVCIYFQNGADTLCLGCDKCVLDKLPNHALMSPLGNSSNSLIDGSLAVNVKLQQAAGLLSLD